MCRYNFGARKRIITPMSNMIEYTMTREREREDEREVDRECERAYINKPREKTPKIIPAREEINPWITGDAQGEKRRSEQERQGGA